MRIGRLLQMGMGELSCRSRQEASKWLERRGVAGGANGDLHFLKGEAASILDRFHGSASSRFFEGCVGSDASDFYGGPLSPVRAAILAEADLLCRGRFNLLGYHDLSFGNPVDWHLDPIAGRRAPRAHWSRLDPLDPSVVGDSKVTWELNRHQWLVRLGQAYRLSGDERYAETFAQALRSWIEANPRGLGINWASSLEVSLRVISWCWALCLFRESKALSPELFVRVLAAIQAQASHVERYLSYCYSPNTHLTGEALGLFYAGVLFPEMRSAARWRSVGERILLAECERQILPDGVYFEQSTCYQRYTAEIYLHFLILAARNGIGVPAGVGERVRRMLDVLIAVRRPDGSTPQIGDSDGGWLLPLAARTADDFSGIFSTAAAFFGRSDYAWAAGGVTPEVLWLLGARGREAFTALRPTPPGTPPSRRFADGGYVIMRTSWETAAHQLILDAGPLGCPVSGGHGHADLLSIQCSVFGETFLTDAGTDRYTPAPEWRDAFRSTAAHSTVLVDGASQAVPAGPFRWQSRPEARLHQWISTHAFDFADASHAAYRRLPDPVLHRRRVLFVKPRYWLLADDLEGEGVHGVELQFQFAPSIAVSVDSTLWARARGTGKRGLCIKPFAAVPLAAEVCSGRLRPIRGWVSSHYGQRQPAPCLVYSATVRLPLRIVTLIQPSEDPQALPPSVSVLEDAHGGCAGVSLDAGGETVRFDTPSFSATGLDPDAHPGLPSPAPCQRATGRFANGGATWSRDEG